MAEGIGLIVGADGLGLRPPALHIAPDRGAMPCALARAAEFAKVDLLAEARADEPARIPCERPAHGSGAPAEVMAMLLRLIRVVPAHFLFESPGVLVVVDAPNVRAH